MGGPVRIQTNDHGQDPIHSVNGDRSAPLRAPCGAQWLDQEGCLGDAALAAKTALARAALLLAATAISLVLLELAAPGPILTPTPLANAPGPTNASVMATFHYH